MSLWSNLVGLLSKGPVGGATKLTAGRVEHVENWSDYRVSDAAPGASYVQWYLQDMWLPYDRNWLNNYAPMVYSSIKQTFDGAQLEMPATAGALVVGANVDFTSLQDAFRQNYPLSPLLPYMGGDIELAAGLLALKTRDGIRDVMDAATSLTDALRLSEVSAVLGIIDPVVKTLDSVFGADPFVLGLHDSFKHGGPRPVRSGFFLAASAPAPVDLTRLVVDAGRLHWDTAAHVREFSYMLFRLDVSDTITDLKTQLPEVWAGWEAAVREAGNGDEAQAETLLRAARLNASLSPKLSELDQLRIPLAMKTMYEERLKATGIAGDGAAVDEVVERGFDEILAEVSASSLPSRSELQHDILTG